MPLIDISVTTAPSTPEWPGDTPFSCGWTWDMSQGASVNVSTITSSPHIGTHADAPLHVQPGAPGADELPIAAFIGPATVVDVSHFGAGITLHALDELLEPLFADRAQRLLLKTNRSIASGTFPQRWPSLTAECAQQLVARGVMLVGVDAPSVDDRESKTLEVHHALFDGGAYILENLDLQHVAPGAYQLMAFPAKFGGVDAAPVRAILATIRQRF